MLSCRKNLIFPVFLALLDFVFCQTDYQTVLEDWIWEDPALVNYETCRKAVNTLRWDAPQDDRDLYSIFGMNDVMLFRHRDPTGLARSSVIHKTKLWKDGQVPYSVPYGLSRTEKRILACAMLFFHEHTCIRFVPNHYLRPYRDYISIRKGTGGCFSEDMGKKGGMHVVNLQSPYCWDQGTVIHELMHAIGFFHEQARNDRDKYITVHWDNIPDSGWKYQFLTGKETGVGQQLIGEYDYGSIMHYPRFSYAWGDLPTMSAKRGDVLENNKKMGNRAKPTEMDIKKINMLYQCRGSSIKTDKKTSGGDRFDQQTRTKLENGQKPIPGLEDVKRGSWIVPVVILAVLVVFNIILVLAIIAYRRRKQLIHRYRGFSNSSSSPPALIAKDIESSAAKTNKPLPPLPVKFRQPSAPTVRSTIQVQKPDAPQRPNRPRDTIIRDLHEEVGSELNKNRFSWLFAKKSKPVPLRKAPPPPLPELKPKQNMEKSNVKTVSSATIDEGINISRVQAMKKNFEIPKTQT